MKNNFKKKLSFLKSLKEIEAVILYGSVFLKKSKDIDIQIVYKNARDLMTSSQFYKKLVKLLYKNECNAHIAIITSKEIFGSVCSPFNLKLLKLGGYRILYGNKSLYQEIEKANNSSLNIALSQQLDYKKSSETLRALGCIGNILQKSRRNLLKAEIFNLTKDYNKIVNCLTNCFDNSFFRYVMLALNYNYKGVEIRKRILKDLMRNLKLSKKLANQINKSIDEKESAIKSPTKILHFCRLNKKFIEITLSKIDNFLISSLKS